MSDRFVVERLRRRVLAWGGPGAEDLDARRIVSDAAAAMALLGRIGLRPELRQHDLRTAHRALELVEPARSSAEARSALLTALEALRGRDSGLDQLTAAFQRGSAVGWRLKAALAKVVEELDAPACDPFGF